MKLNIWLLISILLLLGCTSKQEKVYTVQSCCSESIGFIADSSLSRITHIQTEGYMPKEGYIVTAELAAKLAFNILSEIYGEKEIKEQLPFSINLKDDIWIIEGYIEKNADGGSAYIEINKQTGEILKIMHSK